MVGSSYSIVGATRVPAAWLSKHPQPDRGTDHNYQPQRTPHSIGSNRTRPQPLPQSQPLPFPGAQAHLRTGLLAVTEEQENRASVSADAQLACAQDEIPASAASPAILEITSPDSPPSRPSAPAGRSPIGRAPRPTTTRDQDPANRTTLGRHCEHERERQEACKTYESWCCIFLGAAQRSDSPR